MESLRELRSLVQVMSSALDTIEENLLKDGLEFPSPHSPFTYESEAVRYSPTIVHAVADITAAATQLTAFVRPAPVSIINMSMTVSISFFQT